MCIEDSDLDKLVQDIKEYGYGWCSVTSSIAKRLTSRLEDILGQSISTQVPLGVGENVFYFSSMPTEFEEISNDHIKEIAQERHDLIDNGRNESELPVI